MTYPETYDLLSGFPRTDAALDFPKTYRDAMFGDGRIRSHDFTTHTEDRTGKLLLARYSA